MRHALPQQQAIDGDRARSGLHAGFLRSAESFTEQPALIHPHRTLNFGELEQASRRIGARLQAHGVRPGQLVGVLDDGGWEACAIRLGVLRVGAAFVSMGWPSGAGPDLQATMTAVGCTVLAAGAPVQPMWTLPAAFSLLVLDGSDLLGDQPEPDRFDEVAIDEAGLACVVHTSGVTGKPKAVALTHAALAAMLEAVGRLLDLRPTDRVLSVSPPGFDLALFDLFGLWGAGGAVVSAGHLDSTNRWIELMHRQRVTVWNSIPRLLERVLDAASQDGLELPQHLRLVLLSRERVAPTLLPRLSVACPDAAVMSFGGMTEAGVWSTFQPLAAGDAETPVVILGTPLPGQTVRVYSDRMKPCPNWVPGEIYIGGACLAAGYWGDEAGTREAFLVHPDTGERLHRSMDRGRQLPDGRIEWVGRAADNINVGGVRIDLGEIEAVLLTPPAVREATVHARRYDGKLRLLAHVALQATGPALTPADLIAHVAAQLPSYMVPDRVLVSAQLPRTWTGKRHDAELARAELPPQEGHRGQPPGAAVRPASGADVERLLRIVSQVLGTEVRDPTASLLDLGATSIHVIRIVNQIENETGVRVPMEELFRVPDLNALAALLHAMATDVVVRDTGLVAAADEAGVLLDPAARDTFKKGRRGLRADLDNGVAWQLPVHGRPASAQAVRRTHRRFSSQAVAMVDLAALLACLRSEVVDGEARYLYPSAGSAYAVQTYVYVKPGRVEGLAAGTYYHDPAEHRLIALHDDSAAMREAHDWVNRPVFDQGAFALFFAMDRHAIEPLYGARSRDYSLYEAGAIGQLLMTQAAPCGIGLCVIGSVDFERVRPLLLLGEQHELVSSMIGGGLPGRAAERAADVGATIGEMLAKLEQLSKEDVQRMLEERRRNQPADGAAAAGSVSP